MKCHLIGAMSYVSAAIQNGDLEALPGSSFSRDVNTGRIASILGHICIRVPGAVYPLPVDLWEKIDRADQKKDWNKVWKLLEKTIQDLAYTRWSYGELCG